MNKAVWIFSDSLFFRIAHNNTTMERINYPEKVVLQKEYDELFGVREAVARELVISIFKVLKTLSSPPSIKARVKSFNSLYKKILRNLKDGYDDPFAGVNDIIGIRVVCPFLEDLSSVEELLKKNFQITEVDRKGWDHTFREFGYESIHLLIKIPEEIIGGYGLNCDTAEIQIRTILQDAWAEVEHELVYKAEFNPFDNPMKRKLAAVNASLSLADIIFQEIRSFQRQFNGELEKRRDSFFQKIEETTDAFLFADMKPLEIEAGRPLYASSNASIDELLLNALYAHNKLQFDEAIGFYTQILELDPDDTVKSLILKHRGMAFFARSNYEKAIDDFARSLELDPKSYKSAYYQGVVYSVLRKYREAIDVYNQSLGINPYQPFCLYRRGQAYFHLEDYPQALADCESALALESFEGAVKFKQLLLHKLKM